MRKNLIALFLSVILAAGMVSPASVCAAEIPEQETVSAENEAAQKEEAEEQAQIEAEEPAEDNKEESAGEKNEESTEDTTAEQKEESAPEGTEDPVQESADDPAADAAEEEASPDMETKSEELFTDEIAVAEGIEEVVCPGDTGKPSSDELFSVYVDRSFEREPLYAASRKKRSSVSALQGYDRAVYNYIAGFLPQIAAGERASTVFEITPEIMGAETTSWTAEELGGFSRGCYQSVQNSRCAACRASL